MAPHITYFGEFIKGALLDNRKDEKAMDVEDW